jgi:hypothetical protein
MNDLKSYTVELDVTRHVTVVIEAADPLKAREKAANLDFKHEIVGEITRWEVKRITPVKVAS